MYVRHILVDRIGNVFQAYFSSSCMAACINGISFIIRGIRLCVMAMGRLAFAE